MAYSCFDVFEGRGTLFEGFSTYLDTCFSFKELKRFLGCEHLVRGISTFLEGRSLHVKM